MTSFSQTLAAAQRRWAFVARVEGVGRWRTNAERAAGVPDGRYRWCTAVPSYAGSATEPSDLWRPHLGVLGEDGEAEFPDVLAEQLAAEGGIADRAASLTLVLHDAADFITSLLAIDATPVTTISVGTAAATTILCRDAAGVSRLGTTDVLYVDGEALEVTAIPGSSGSSSVDVVRGALGTDAVPHDFGSACFLVSPFLGGRRVQLYLTPLDGDSVADEQLVGEYALDSVKWDEGLNAWILAARSQQQALEASLPEAPYVTTGYTETEDTGGEIALLVDDDLPAADWGHLHLEVKGEILRATRTDERRLAVEARGRAGTNTEILDPEARVTLRRVLVPDPDASDFRASPGPSPSTSRSSGTWDELDDPVSILLCVLTSSRTASDGLELANYLAARGNYSSLPVGYGLGVLASDIDWDSFEEVRDRLPDVRLHNLVIGEAQTGKDWINEHILRPLQLHITLSSGQLRLVKVRAPLTGQTLTQIDASVILMRPGEPMVGSEGDGGTETLPDVEISRDFGSNARRVEYEVGPRKVPAISQSANPTRTRRTITVPVPGGSTDRGQLLLWQALATGLARQAYRPRSVAAIAVDAARWGVAVGALVEVTLPEAPDLQAGARGWTQQVAQLLYREPRADLERGVWLHHRFKLYGDGQLARRLGPAAQIDSVLGDVATCVANRYTDSDSNGGLPTVDVAAFEVGDVVRLRSADGELLDSGSTETVISVTPGSDEIELSGDFSGAMVSSTRLVHAGYDDATADQQGEHAWLAENDHRVGTADGDPTTFEEL